MKATELIGKLAIRTAPTKKIGDYSYSGYPIFIIKATETHISYKDTLFGAEIHVGILNSEWCDDNWIDFEENFPPEIVEQYLKLKA